MEYSAIFHDMDKRFCYAIDKDLFVIRVQVKKGDMKEVILHYEDKYIPMERKDTRMTLPMKKVATSQFHDYYEAQLQMHLICLRYFFEFTDMQGEKVYYGNYEFDKECITNRDRMFDCPQNLREEEMFEVPQWAANKVVYQIFPSRFAATQPVDKKLWYKAPITPMDDLHGNLRGIIEHLDDMKDLGIDVVYLTPIFQSNSCHKYDTARFLHLCKDNKKKQHLAAAFQLLLPGMPMIYYGDEYAMPGANDPDCRRGMYWDEEYQDKEMYQWYKKLMQIRKTHACIVEGEMIETVANDDEDTIVMIRKNGEETIAMLFNCGSSVKKFNAYAQKYNLLTDSVFDGKVDGLDAAVIVL